MQCPQSRASIGLAPVFNVLTMLQADNSICYSTGTTLTAHLGGQIIKLLNNEKRYRTKIYVKAGFQVCVFFKSIWISSRKYGKLVHNLVKLSKKCSPVIFVLFFRYSRAQWSSVLFLLAFQIRLDPAKNLNPDPDPEDPESGSRSRRPWIRIRIQAISYPLSENNIKLFHNYKIFSSK